MATDLTTAVLKRAEAEKPRMTVTQHYDGVLYENARLKPLIRELCAELEAAEAALAQTIRYCGAALCTFPLCEADCFIEVNKVRLRLAKFKESLK